MHPTSFEHRMNAWTPIDSRRVPGRSAGSLLRVWHLLAGARSLPAGTGIRAADRNLQSLTQQRDCVLLTVLGDELELHTWPREKMPIAFFRMSRSCRSTSFSRFQ